MIQRLRRFRALDHGDRRLILEAIALLSFVRIGLLLVRFPRLRRFLDRYSQNPAVAGSEPVRRITWVLDAASGALPWSTSCLVKALAADAMLRRRALDSRLHLGVLPAPFARLDAHAWVECQGAIVTGDIEGLSNYARLSVNRGRSATEALAALLRHEEVSWRELASSPADVLDACVREDLTGLIYERLRNPNGHDWPPEFVERLAVLVRIEAAKETLRRREIVAVLDALAAERITPVLLKGTPLAYGVYDTPSSRRRNDTDMLIKRDDAEAVRRAMTARGYVAPRYCDAELLFCQFELARTDEFGVDHAFDFHWKISTQTIFADVLDYEELVTDSVAVPSLGALARAAGPVHALLLACIHPVMHHRNEERLIWIYDVHLLVSRLSPEQLKSFALLAVRKGVAAICAHRLELARSRFGTDVPRRVRARLSAIARSEPTARYLRRNRRWHQELMASLRGLPRWTDRVQLLREVLFPRTQYMLALYGVSAGSGRAAILPALYAHRMFYGAWKVLTGRK